MVPFLAGLPPLVGSPTVALPEMLTCPCLMRSFAESPCIVWPPTVSVGHAGIRADMFEGMPL